MSIIDKVSSVLEGRTGSRLEYFVVRDTTKITNNILIHASPKGYCESYCETANKRVGYERFILEPATFERFGRQIRQEDTTPFSYARENSGSGVTVYESDDDVKEKKIQKLLDRYLKK